MEDAQYERGNYGIDAPKAIGNLVLLGIGFLILGVTAFYVFPTRLHWLGDTIGSILLLSFLIVIVESLYMVWSSKVGKLRMREKLIELVQLRGDELLLDVGCGRGLILNAAARRLTTGKAYGIDIWNKQDQSGNDPKETIENARIEGVAERVEVVNGDMRDIPFPDDHFDVIVSSLAVHNIYNRAERYKALGEMIRVLKPGGQLAILDFQHVREYADALRELGTLNVQLTGPYWTMFPSVRIVTGSKKTAISTL
ncbi:2-methoxy-6-polyprenyl-1,4-benzoquinol methylase, mitochondrial [Paenibacillus sp. CECT 9249]|uniref:class I SAM-dependent methyltransferase n=1 Tax=Paenibacillus sp. CECT 9249 TaxID=2845385 RepID=UPI001E3F2E62|nr:class I SAM-dependent methyltransferase [Paenibacillus sp. CECT 9249]CAH0120814.1 2-methoxy-6-polyprenyl-1,4-benzoquinol methylase, mitochondrial [Paenibacillus sp. CECT 9249]